MSSGAVWVELKDPKDRKYYHNKITGETRWDKPIELQTASELAQSKSVWKEFISDNGRKYYYNTQTKESAWEEPQELKMIRLQFAPQSSSSSAPTPNSQTNNQNKPPPQTQYQQQQQLIHDKQVQKQEIQNHTSSVNNIQNGSSNVEKSNNSNQPPQPTSPKSPGEAQYKDQQQRYDAFRQLLNDFTVTSTWNWDLTMRTIINDPRYGALKTIQEKKKALADHQADRRAQEREDKRKQEAKQRELFITMLKECTYLKPRMNWQRAVPYFEG
jgi:pre-mRNA-processing factor 40